MTYIELVERMKEMNRIYPNRFMVNDTDGRLAICGEDFSFTPDTYNNTPDYEQSALDFINEYGMLKLDGECYGKQLYYKGIKWDELSKELKQTVIDLYKDNPNFIKDESQYERLFNDNRCFLEF